MPIDWNAAEHIESVLENHLVEILNLLRDGVRTDLISSWFNAPPWLVQRIGNDAGYTEDATGYWSRKHA